MKWIILLQEYVNEDTINAIQKTNSYITVMYTKIKITNKKEAI